MNTAKKLVPARPIITTADIDALEQTHLGVSAILRASLDAGATEREALVRAALELLCTVDLTWHRKAIEAAEQAGAQ